MQVWFLPLKRMLTPVHMPLLHVCPMPLECFDLEGVRHQACVHSDSPLLDSKVPCSLGVALTMLVVVRSSLLPVVMVM